MRIDGHGALVDDDYRRSVARAGGAHAHAYVSGRARVVLDKDRALENGREPGAQPARADVDDPSGITGNQ
jgi:hypothetical protein